MSLERYMQRAHDEARRLLRDCPWLRSPLRSLFGLQRVLDRAMADTDGSTTLGPGEGAEARRLLEMVAWDRVPQASWPEAFDTLRMAVVWRSAGHENWVTAMRSLLEEDGHLVDGAKRCAA